MYRDPFTGPIHYTITQIITELAYLSQCHFASQEPNFYIDQTTAIQMKIDTLIYKNSLLI